MATRPGSRTPRPRRRTESTMEYTAVVTATPIASERIAKIVKSGVAPSRLRASLMSLTTRGSVASLVAQGHTWIRWAARRPGTNAAATPTTAVTAAMVWEQGAAIVIVESAADVRRQPRVIAIWV